MLKQKIRALASYINPVNWPIYYEYYERRAYRRTLEINANRLTLFGAVSDDREKIIFGLSNGKESFSASLNTILMCLEIAESGGDVPALDEAWWRATNFVPPVLDYRALPVAPLIHAMGNIFLWIRQATSEAAPGRVIAGQYVDLHRAEDLSTCRIPRNVPDGQKIAFALSDLAHNMADVASGENDFFTAEYFAHECQRVARMEFSVQCWGLISAGLIGLAEAFKAVPATGETGGMEADCPEKS